MEPDKIILLHRMGKKCYEILQAGGCACAICNNEALVEGQFIEWHHYNPVLQKHYMLKDTMIVEDGRRYRLEIALDDSLHDVPIFLRKMQSEMMTIPMNGWLPG